MGKYERTPVDHSKIAFPSDAITLGQARAMEPGLLEETLRHRRSSVAGAEAFMPLELEMLLADMAYLKAAGLPALRSSYSDAVDILNDLYVKYGLSTGMKATQQLVKRIEQQAVAQVPKQR